MFRALYSEKRVVAEERRARIDNAPLGRFQEAFAGAALGNNYRRPVIGYAQDVEALVRGLAYYRSGRLCRWCISEKALVQAAKQLWFQQTGPRVGCSATA